MSNRARPVWPYVCVLIALFTLSLMAPERWEEASRNARLSTHEPATDTRAEQVRLRASSDVPADQDQPSLDYGALLKYPPQIDAPADLVWSLDGPETCDWVSRPVTGDRAGVSQSPPDAAICSTPESSRPLDQAGQVANPPVDEEEPRLEITVREVGESTPADSTTETDDLSADAAPPPSPAPNSIATETEPASDLVAPSLQTRPPVASGQAESPNWTLPHDLLEQLESLRSEPEAGAWATSTLSVLDEITAAGGPRVAGDGQLERVHELAVQAIAMADRVTERYVSRRLRVAGYGLGRRLAIWHALAEAADAMHSNAEPAVASDSSQRNDRLTSCVDDVDKLTDTAPAGAGWHKYLLIDQVRQLAGRRGACGDDAARDLARDVLRRLDPQRMTQRQRRFVEREPVVALAAELRNWAAADIDLDRIQANLEEYELTGRPSAGRQVLADTQLLSYSAEPAALKLARAVEANYRVPNLRMTISDDLLQKMMPKQDPRHQYIRNVILGMEAHGQTTTTSNIRIAFAPDPSRLRFVMHVTGMIHARATSEKGLIKVHSRAESDYVVLKNFEFTLDGLQAEPAQADAHTRARLRGVDTPLEPVPLLGSVLEGYVRDRYRSSKRAAERELRRQIMAKVIEQVEKETDHQIVDANDRLKKNLLDPLRALDLEPAVATMQTTEDRMTIRLRLAGDDQLAANTPRPRAPADSLASIQMHESALNNIIARLELDGREFSQLELHRWVGAKLNRPLEQADDNLRDDVFLKFADRDAVRARALEGRVELTLSMDELRAEGSRYRNFVVRVYYRPDENSTSGELVRDGVVQLIGQGLGPKAQIALRGVFSKTFSKERRFRLLPPKFTKDEQLADVGITQMVIQDGWFGMGIGTIPREAAKSRHARR
ncbi:MAG: hypothetical protein K2Y37_10300 [Pirellulales bacterium]|nr:hypothetical protein [Pirellulales bacterium]